MIFLLFYFRFGFCQEPTTISCNIEEILISIGDLPSRVSIRFFKDFLKTGFFFCLFYDFAFYLEFFERNIKKRGTAFFNTNVFNTKFFNTKKNPKKSNLPKKNVLKNIVLKHFSVKKFKQHCVKNVGVKNTKIC